MSLVIKELRILNFRNHRSFYIHEPRRLIIITGKNATGKTNIIEAVQLVTMLESFRNPTWSSVVRKRNDDPESLESSENPTTVRALFLQNERSLEIQMDIEEGRRIYTCNGKKKNKLDLIGLVPSVIFIPDDLALVKDSAEVRRKLIDDIGQQLSPTYLRILDDYQKTVKQRNVVLKEYCELRQNTPLLESWDENLIVLGALLFTHRVRLYKRYMEKVAGFYRQFTENEEFSSRYIPSFFGLSDNSDPLVPDDRYTDDMLVKLQKNEVENHLRDSLEKNREKEYIRQKTLVGPHRDEIMFYINGLEARKYASQGQQRSIALALKLGQLALIREINGNEPILLLDDVMSELDEDRREALIKAIEGQIQTIITATDLSFFSEKLLEHAQIIELS